MWFWILIIVIAIGAFIGFVTSEDGERGVGSAGGGCLAGMGCGYVLFLIFIFGAAILLVLWLFGKLFG